MIVPDPPLTTEGGLVPRSGPGYGAYAPRRADYPIRYDTSTHELSEGLSRSAGPWTAADVHAELRRRATVYRAEPELVVHYYRIGHSLAFELPLAHRPTSFPVGILGERPYPWLIWLGWALEERWRVFAAASRAGVGDEDALAAELAALAEWESYDADYGGAGLVTASLASAVSDVLAHRSAHTPATVDAARAAAERMLAVTVLPWFEESTPPPGELPPKSLHNIPCITLFRGAQLATALGSPHATALQERAARIFAAWLDHRQRPDPLTEGVAYDGFLLDSMTEWLTGRPDLHDSGSAALRAVPAAFADLALPGRPDIVAPIGDCEAEMPFWAGAAIRLCRTYDLTAEAAWYRRFPLPRLPGNALTAAAELASESAPGEESARASGDELPSGRREQPSTVTLRTGWDTDDLLVAIGAGHTQMGHLHCDAGQVVIGWRERFWITDPGYQQYVAGAERDYTLGEWAHNPPVIGGVAQSARAARRTAYAEQPWRVRIDASACYPRLGVAAGFSDPTGLSDPAGPSKLAVLRDVQLLPELGAVVVRDELRGLPAGTAVVTSWLGGAGLAWGFVGGRSRLTNGRDALWVVNADAGLSAEQLSRHPGTRGSVHLRHEVRTATDVHVARWVFLTDHGATRELPAERIEAALAVTANRLD